MRRPAHCVAASLLASLVAFYPQRSCAVSFLTDDGATAAESAALAARWSAGPDPLGLGTGLHDGIKVGISPTFASDLGVPEIAVLFGLSEQTVTEKLEATIRRAFGVWETPAIRFDLGTDEFNQPSPATEIDLFAESDGSEFFGYTFVDSVGAPGRRLTNGNELPGGVIYHAEIFINRDRILDGAAALAGLGIRIDLVAAALQILIAHEIGHAIGLGHPNEAAFLDTDTDPYNNMLVNPSYPFRDLSYSFIPSDTPAALLPIMWGGLSASSEEDLFKLFVRLLDPRLSADDRAGLDILYPVVPYTCYRAGKTRGALPFEPLKDKAVRDQFEAGSMDVRKPIGLCNAAALTGELGEPEEHNYLSRYAAKASKGSTRFETVSNQRLRDQFGSALRFDVKESRLFQTPAAASSTSVPSPLTVAATDHFRCRRVKVAKGSVPFTPVLNYPVRDELGSTHIDVLRPVQLCSPAEYEGQASGAEARSMHLMCYKIRRSRGEPRLKPPGSYYADDVLGDPRVDLLRPAELCVQAVLNP